MKSEAFIFPGQGSQYVGMLCDIAKQNPIIENTFREASEVLGYDLWAMTQTDEHNQLGLTQYTQPALLCASVALWRAYCEDTEDRPDYMAGHSLGEYTALTCAGALSFSDAITLTAFRGACMQEAVAEGVGAMAAIIGLDDDILHELCQTGLTDEVVACANFNCPGQVVIAGHSSAVKRVMNSAKEHGAKIAKQLEVSVPSHCALMRDAATAFETQLSQIKLEMPAIPVIHNVNAMSAQSAEEIRQHLSAQLYQPVLWSKTITHLISSGVCAFIECGPGNVLAGLCKRIDRSTPCHNLEKSLLEKQATSS